MKTNLKIYLSVTALLFCTALLASCEKLIDVGQPSSQLSAESVFENDNTALAVLNNLYGSSLGYAGGGLGSSTLLGAMASDETTIYSTSLDIQQLGSGQSIPSSATSGALWPSVYQSIYNANTLIEGVKNNPHLSEAVRAQVTGEALFFRALGHLTLVGFYGDVPLVTSTDFRLNTTASRTSSSTVLAQVISDLKQSAALLPSDYTLAAGERIRVNSVAAKALLARAYLYAADYQNAETVSSEVIAMGSTYTLLPLAQVFLKNSREAILQLRASSTTINAADGSQFILTGRPTLLALANGFADGFETGDQRKSNWTGKFTLGAESWYFPNKYKVKSSSTITEYTTVLRLGEQYLIRSEARARQHKLVPALTDLDAIRFRAGLSRIGDTNPSISETDLLEKILSERKSELFTEWAHRWIDLKRFGRAQQVLPAAKPGWKSSALLFPIPQSEINVNANLAQNPGY